MKHSVWIGLAAALTLLSACDRAKAPDAPPAAPAAAVERAGPVRWNEAAKAFELNGKPLKAAKLWTFEGTTEGFTVMTSKVASPQPAQGLALTIVDPTLRTPKGLNIVGGDYPVVLMRITRVAPGGSLWDGALYYSTPIHGEAIGFLGKPLQGDDPAVGETTTLVYDMSRQTIGGDDWVKSTIDQIRFDIEDKPGGQVVIHQVAVVENPDPLALGTPKPKKKKLAPQP